MRKKKASLILKFLLICIVIGVSFLYTSPEDQVSSESFQSPVSGSAIAYTSPVITSNTIVNSKISEGQSFSNYSDVYVPSLSSSQGSSGGFGTIKDQTDASASIVIHESSEQSTVMNGQYSSGGGPGGSVYNSVIMLPQKSEKKSKENKNTFGTTIASGNSGFGITSASPIDLPLAPGPPAPLDGGTIILLLLGISVAIYKLFIAPKMKIAQV